MSYVSAMAMCTNESPSTCHLKQSFFVLGELREEGGKGGIGDSCNSGRIGEGLVLGLDLVLVLLGILARCPKDGTPGQSGPPRPCGGCTTGKSCR